MKEEDMKCKGIGELLTAYLDGEVTEKEKALVESHLSDCPQCKAGLESLKVTQVNLKSALTSMAGEVAPSTEAWRNVRAKIEKKNGWRESLGNILSNQRWQGVAITAMVVVIAVSVTIWQIRGAGQSRSLVAPAPPGSTTAVPTTPKIYDTPTTPATAPPPAQVTVNIPSVTVPAPAPAPAPTTPPPPITPPPTAIPPPNINVGAPPPTVTVQAPPPAAVVIQAPPPAQVTVNPPAVTVQSPPPAQVTVNVPAQSPQPISVPLWVLVLLPIILIVGVIIIFVSGRRAKV